MRVARLALRRALAACAVTASLAAAGPPAGAWIPYTTDAGIPLAWPAGTTLDVAIRLPLPSGFTSLQIVDTVAHAFDAWLLQRQCHPPRLDVIRDDLAIDLDESDGVTAIVFFTDQEAWRARFGASELARTLVKFDPGTGAITDADIAVNTAGFVFDATPGAGCSDELYDLRATLTHEVGHVLGLDHSLVRAATMDPHEVAGACEKRDLDPDDLAGLCALYVAPDPPETEPDAGPETPADGTSPDAATSEFVADRAARLPDDCAAGGPSVLACLGLAFAAWLRRARRSSARYPQGPCPSRARS